MNFKKLHIIFLALFSSYLNVVLSQVSFSFGITSNLGTTIDRIGVFFLPQVYNPYIQCNARAGLTYNLRSYGTKKCGPELQLGIGIILPFGKKDSINISPIDLLSNQTGRKFSFAYSYNLYHDKAGTSQATGIFGFQTRHYRFLTENDILALTKQDRYRTAAAIISYIENVYTYSIKAVLWTGDSFDSKAVKVTNDTIYHSRFGYKDLSKAAWGKNSVGILCFQAERAYSVVSPQMAKVMVGIDAEQVRQILQNKIVHDMYFVPERWVGYKNVHYPMLQKDGTPCLSRPGQKVRSPKPFFNVALNDNLFY